MSMGSFVKSTSISISQEKLLYPLSLAKHMFNYNSVFNLLGIPPSYAVANEANNILATSVSGSLTHWYKNTLDYKMGLMIVSGGVVGTLLGITTFSYFKSHCMDGNCGLYSR